MNNMNDSLPDLMRRATETLEPESTDLVERGMKRGAVLRRRRTALLSLSGTTAVLVTAGIVFGGTQVLGSPDHKQAPVASAPAAAATTPAKPAAPATGKDTLATLRKLVPAGLQISKPTSMDGGLGGQNSASIVVDDGNGASWLMVTTGYAYGNPTDCSNSLPHTCTIQADGSALEAVTREAVSRNGHLKEASSNYVMLTRPNGTQVALTSMSAAGEGSPVTRKQPLFTLTELAKLAGSKNWGYPPKKTITQQPAAEPKPPVVPLPATLATLKKVIPGHPQLSQPHTWGGGQNGYNGASYVTNDGKGASSVDALLTTSAPVKKCPEEGLSHCKVRSDGSVLAWANNVPSYDDSRQQKYGIVGNFIQLYLPDGRTINMSSFNGLGEKPEVKHTRAAPAYTVEQLTNMADSKLWIFPGGTK
ncbi:hypothetical protein F1D05_28200 [Kribbella qitaiheensis]|uniref:Uncharacterized protein n=1 Tax=Kribbella qitaiheensis TaxID=1544730 RepID=A0A7G6X4B9_9ACTN|nr:hypothetical protein [Kribbella qitaiheensis]QNE21084.1 hypothetical protein F1D05_28200 [Kribbella qitaiheensis]